MSRPLLYGIGGEVLAREGALDDEMRVMLVDCFAYASGFIAARAGNNVEQQQALMDQARERILRGIIALEGMKQAIEECLNVEIALDPVAGGFVMRARPPKPPRPPGT